MPDDAAFRLWYKQMASKHGLSEDPSGQFYDYYSAYKANASPDQTGHWPSDFKLPGHPDEFVGGFSTITGKRNPSQQMLGLRGMTDRGWGDSSAIDLLQQNQSQWFNMPGDKPLDLNALIKDKIMRLLER